LCADRAPAGDTVTIAAASDLIFCLDALNAEFKTQHPGARLKTSTGSSGNFFAQIQRGAPFDVFLSADAIYPKRLAESGHAAADSLTRYALGRIVLWTARADLAVTNGLTVLTNALVRRLAIANPAHAPYGRAAQAALERAGLWDAVRRKVVLGENVTQAAQFVQTGNADAGLVSLSLVLAPKLKDTGRWWLIPEEAHPLLEQAAVLTRRGETNALAKVYLDFLRSESAASIFERFGFRLPEGQ
jgi:molybdate transport system substrate-binding protein